MPHSSKRIRDMNSSDEGAEVFNQRKKVLRSPTVIGSSSKREEIADLKEIRGMMKDMMQEIKLNTEENKKLREEMRKKEEKWEQEKKDLVNRIDKLEYKLENVDKAKRKNNVQAVCDFHKGSIQLCTEQRRTLYWKWDFFAKRNSATISVVDQGFPAEFETRLTDLLREIHDTFAGEFETSTTTPRTPLYILQNLKGIYHSGSRADVGTSEFASPIVIVTKKNRTGLLRLSQTKPCHAGRWRYTAQHPRNPSDLETARVFSSLDLKSRHCQVPMAIEYKPYTSSRR
ncbi:hypothetical protein FQR65_LT08759 [Abscondita terminalis]|nr:hypothetical protein FQR65_LT08759 [Abscondita terminalis]